jgi:signal transduction histidine kinase
VTKRLLLTYLSLTAIVLAVLVVPLGVVNSRDAERELTSKVERDAVAVASLAEDSLEAGASEAPPALQRLADGYLEQTGGRIVVVDEHGTALVDASDRPGRSFASRPEIAEALGGQVSTGIRSSESLGTDLLYVAVPVASGGVVHGAVRITYPTSTLDARVRRYWLLLGVISAVVLALAALIGLSLARWATRPLRRLEDAAAEVGAGDLNVRVPEEGPDEVRALARTFNDTVGKLDALVDSQQAFVADASHQLRTPLTALRLRLENLERDLSPDASADLAAALAEVGRLGEIVDALLALARADSDASPPERLDLPEVLAERVAVWSAVAERRHVAIELHAATAPPVLAARERVEQVVDNLLSNALAVSPPGRCVIVTLSTSPGYSEISIADEGPGLTTEEREHAFDRFWRKRNGAGSGLGLAIARRLVEADGGTIELRDSTAGGIEARVTLPLATR